MKKPLGKEAMELEAAYWTALRKTLSDKPVKVCRK